jgi:hypothetical protein
LFRLTDCNEVNSVILTSKPTTSNGDPIPTPLLRSCLNSVLPSIVQLFNLSLSSGIFPICFKHAHITPLIKSPSLDPNQLSNYRPISTLPFLSKVLEGLVLHRLLPHIQEGSLFDPHQSGFRPHHSTVTALTKINADMLNSLDQIMQPSFCS